MKYGPIILTGALALLVTLSSAQEYPEVYIADWDISRIAVFNGSNNQNLGSIPASGLGDTCTAVDQAGRVLYVGSRNLRLVRRYSIPGRQFLGEMSIPIAVSQMSVGADGKLLLFSRSERSAILTTFGAPQPERILITPNRECDGLVRLKNGFIYGIARGPSQVFRFGTSDLVFSFVSPTHPFYGYSTYPIETEDGKLLTLVRDSQPVTGTQILLLTPSANMTWTPSYNQGTQGWRFAFAPMGVWNNTLYSGVHEPSSAEKNQVGRWSMITGIMNAGNNIGPGGDRAGQHSMFINGRDKVISGRVLLQDLSNLAPKPLSIGATITDPSGTQRSIQLPVGEDGSYSYGNTFVGNFSISIDLPRYLGQTKVFAGSQDYTSQDFNLICGDVDGDNEVGPSDFEQIVTLFGSNSSSSNWNPNADLNSDGEVGPADFEIVVRNFGLAGN